MPATAPSPAARGAGGDNDYYGAVLSRAAEIEQAYRALTPRSGALFARAGTVFPGGFTRDAIMRKPYAAFVTSGQGSVLTDADGRAITDFWFNATSLPLGHAHPAVVEAAERQLRKGTAYFAPTEHELALAELLIARVPSAERIRFANSGSEAVMMAIRFGRAFSGRPLIVKFEGSYHGSYDDVSWSVSPAPERAGSASQPTPTAESAGLAGTDGRVAVLPFNDAEALRSFITAHHREIGVLLVEPMANRIGLILPDDAFLREARALCDQYGIVLIFDEVIAFRVGYHGAQGLLGVTPDLTTLGKIIGGGFPVGAVAGRADVLDLSSPAQRERVTHAGTFNANPMVAVAGLATMSALTPEVFAGFEATGNALRKRLSDLCEGLPLQVTGAGSLFKITATGTTIRNYRDGATANYAWESTVSLALLNAGFLMTPGLSGVISTATTQAQIDAFIDALAQIIAS
ncbi:aminotransferase class III-fold pyridoxal phosphate-dependent enzyme [Bosea caraganae]|uniref:Aminotransferase class III-fold pyridoxal phosphate-dependent enzyme n=1 Tax=Bosea caraganae TaxID=2763117 RepID=A0A370KYP5_9HYPH|nr:aspartate aminotransferase family protein [Bosea caraganae]RDJ20104.1 aminotransferase class III-fold pyridoxal phosphate-dependent enzyme [Bosea caraganae]RDJ24816.1 aminotransferase class III-fold pyridoxal phosphate-dependent enzyme [Bosea caraganae]